MYLDDLPVGSYIKMCNHKTKRKDGISFKWRVWQKIGDGNLKFIGGVKFNGEVKNDLTSPFATCCPYRRRNYRTIKQITKEEVAILFAL